MTMFTAFTEQFRKQDVCLFSDFFGDSSPFGIVPTATTFLSTAAFSNINTDVSQTSKPLGTVTLSVPSSSNSVPGVYPAIGVYPAAAIPAGGVVNRDFRVGRGEIDFEARVKSAATDPDIIVTVGIGLPTNAAPPAVATDFVGFYAFGDLGGGQTWTAALVVNSTVVRSVTTTLPIAQFTDFRVFLNEDANRAKCYANGALIATFDGQLPTTTGLLPHIEVRDRNQAGSGGGGQNVVADYMMVKLKANR